MSPMRRHRSRLRRHTVKYAGAASSENADMSNDKYCENQYHRKFKGSSAMSVNGGLVDPKARPKGVTDG